MQTILGITIPTDSKKNNLDKIVKYITNPKSFFHIVSLNPENLVVASRQKSFNRVVNKAQIRIVDGIGVILAAQILNVKVGDRLTGVELMEELIKLAGEGRLGVLLIGGEANLAEDLAKCYNTLYPEAKFVGLEGIKDIHKPRVSEVERIYSIVSGMKPRILLVAFGSPWQELWLWQNRHKLKGIVAMGVGGAFDYLSGNIKRPPKWVRHLGLEWFYRLLHQPFRWRRQLRLIEFLWLVAKQRWKKIS